MSVSLDIKVLLDKAFGSGEISRDGINYALKCPACGDSRREKKKLVVRLDDGRYHCWVCGIKGSNVKRLISKYRPGLISYDERIHLRKNEESTEENTEDVHLPSGAQLLGRSGAKDPDIKSTIRYLKSRGLKRSDLYRWRVMATALGSFRRKVIIPSFDNDGNVNYYVARTIDNSDSYKYRNATVSKENVIFNEIDVDWSKEVILVEGVFDAIKCPENTIPILGSSLSTRSKLFKMLSLNQTPCVVALDPDLKEKAYKVADVLSSAGCYVKIAFAPEGEDMGSLDKDQALNVLKNAEPYHDMMRISHKIKSLRSGSVL